MTSQLSHPQMERSQAAPDCEAVQHQTCNEHAGTCCVKPCPCPADSWLNLGLTGDGKGCLRAYCQSAQIIFARYKGILMLGWEPCLPRRLQQFNLNKENCAGEDSWNCHQVLHGQLYSDLLGNMTGSHSG